MKILHTSDWHLGRQLYGQKRYDEFAAFLDWLAGTIEAQKIDVLLVAGDIFDTGTPSNRAQELYYQFLCRVATSSCRHVVVTAGNHDSPTFLNAPRELLKALNVHVVGAKTEDPADEVIVLRDQDGAPGAIICAVPYLRDRNIRTVEAGESIEDKNAKLIAGIREHYASVCRIAEERRTGVLTQAGETIPIIAMGHLFTAGGKTIDGDGVRELYVGSLAHVGQEVFPSAIDYLALGHLHVPQKIGDAETMRYSGSPIPMGFGEAHQQKSVVTITFAGKEPEIETLPAPCFQPLEQLAGSLAEITGRLEELKLENSRAWLEIEYTGVEAVPNLRETIEETRKESELNILRIKNKRAIDRVLTAARQNETLEDLDEKEVFERCLEASQIPEKERKELRLSYHEILTSMHEADENAE